MSKMSSLNMRANPVAIIAAAIFLIGLFLPWWGVDVYGASFARARLAWTVWNPPQFNRLAGGSMLYWNFAVSSIIVLALGLIAAALAIVGSLTRMRRYFIAGILLSGISLALYTVAIEYVTLNSCLIGPPCVSGPVGIATLRTVSGITFAWGFQSGFYASILALLVLTVGLLLNDMWVRDTAVGVSGSR
jgi:hypothetical protein